MEGDLASWGNRDFHQKMHGAPHFPGKHTSQLTKTPKTMYTGKEHRPFIHLAHPSPPAIFSTQLSDTSAKKPPTVGSPIVMSAPVCTVSSSPLLVAVKNDPRPLLKTTQSPRPKANTFSHCIVSRSQSDTSFSFSFPVSWIYTVTRQSYQLTQS